MNTLALRAIVLTELRLRLRRGATLLVLAAVAALSWNMASDWQGGMSMFVVGNARVRYDSAALAIARAMQLAILLGLAGFYVVRGRIAEDTRSGIGSVLATLAVSDTVLLLGRWLASVAVLLMMLLAALAGALASHARYAEGPLQLLPYLQTYLLLMLPGVLFAASMALLADAYAPLVGKLFDAAYFGIWMACAFALELFVKDASASLNPLQLIDFAGFGSALVRLAQLFANPDIRTGGRHSFDAALAPLLMPDGFWALPMLARRGACALVALLPLLFALRHFHRFSPDLLKPAPTGRVQAWLARSGGVQAPLRLLNRISGPLLGVLTPALARATRWPGWRGATAAEIVLTLQINPAALPLLLGCAVLGALDTRMAPLALACWGVLVADIATRAVTSATDAAGDAALGGRGRRIVCQLLATIALGLLFTAGALAGQLLVFPLGAAALCGGVVLFSAAASLLGQISGAPRLFLAPFLFALWFIEDNPTDPAFDLFGAHSLVTPPMLALELGIAIALCAAIYTHQRFTRRS